MAGKDRSGKSSSYRNRAAPYLGSYLGANRDHGVQASKRISRYRSQGDLDEAAIEKIDG